MDNVFGLLSNVGAGFRFSRTIVAEDVDGFLMPMIAPTVESVLVFVNGLYQETGSYVTDGAFIRAVERPWEEGDKVVIIWLQNSVSPVAKVVRQLKGSGIAVAGQASVVVPFVYTLGGTLEVFVDGLLYPAENYVETDNTHIALNVPFSQQKRLDFRSYY